MDRERILEEINELFRDLMDDESIKLTEESSRDNMPEWESLFHMTLMTSIAEDYNIELTTEDILHSNSVADIIDIIQSRSA